VIGTTLELEGNICSEDSPSIPSPSEIDNMVDRNSEKALNCS
jgi:hypothetical protein